MLRWNTGSLASRSKVMNLTPEEHKLEIKTKRQRGKVKTETGLAKINVLLTLKLRDKDRLRISGNQLFSYRVRNLLVRGKSHNRPLFYRRYSEFPLWFLENRK